MAQPCPLVRGTLAGDPAPQPGLPLLCGWGLPGLTLPATAHDPVCSSGPPQTLVSTLCSLSLALSTWLHRQPRGAGRPARQGLLTFTCWFQLQPIVLEAGSTLESAESFH